MWRIEPNVMTECVVLTDPVAYSKQLVAMLRKAEAEVYYSSFVTHLDIPLPGCDVSLGQLFQELGERGVALCVLFNPEAAYGNASADELAHRLPHARIKAVHGSGTLPAAAALVVNNTRYSNHHQKYVCADGHTFMLGGADVSVERSAWLVPNAAGYVWHEVAVVLRCTPAMHQFAVLNFEQVVDNPPFPLTKGYQEYMVLLRLIDTAHVCVHMEAQACICTESSENQVFQAVVQRVRRAVSENTPFYFMLLTNAEQRDEARVVSWVSQKQLHASLRHLARLAAAEGLTPEVLSRHVVVGTLEHAGMHIKVHSNLVIQDGRRMLRSSSNFTDRSWSSKPSDNELGVVLSGQPVAAAQQRLWRQYFHVKDERKVFTPAEAFARMQHSEGVVKCLSEWSLSKLEEVALRMVHGPWLGGQEEVEWRLQ